MFFVDYIYIINMERIWACLKTILPTTEHQKHGMEWFSCVKTIGKPLFGSHQVIAGLKWM